MIRSLLKLVVVIIVLVGVAAFLGLPVQTERQFPTLQNQQHPKIDDEEVCPKRDKPGALFTTLPTSGSVVLCSA